MNNADFFSFTGFFVLPIFCAIFLLIAANRRLDWSAGKATTGQGFPDYLYKKDIYINKNISNVYNSSLLINGRKVGEIPLNPCATGLITAQAKCRHFCCVFGVVLEAK